MSRFCSARILAFFTPFLGGVPANAHIQSSVNDEVVVFKGRTMKIIVPECPLAAGSLKVIPNENRSDYIFWQDIDKQEAYQLIQSIIQIWKQKGITDYLIYGKESGNTSSIFGWEIVPYPKSGWRFWKQFKVLWKISFGGSCLPKLKRQRVAQDYQKDPSLFSTPLTRQIESVKESARDAFCDPNVINKQLVFEGKKVRVLYNYAPIAFGKEKLHFLIVPKEHRAKFSDLTEEEYLESSRLSQKLILFYKNKGHHTAYLFDKSGVEAGQTVPHWHKHLVLTATKTQDVLGKLTVLKNMLIGSSPLPQKELQTRVQSLRKELHEVLSNE